MTKKAKSTMTINFNDMERAEKIFAAAVLLVRHGPDHVMTKPEIEETAQVLHEECSGVMILEVRRGDEPMVQNRIEISLNNDGECNMTTLTKEDDRV
jgi:hypothetical protein